MKKIEIQCDAFRRYWIWQKPNNEVVAIEPNIEVQNKLRLAMWGRDSDLDLLFPRYMEDACLEKVLSSTTEKVEVVKECPEFGFYLDVPLINPARIIVFKNLCYLGRVAKKTGKPQRWGNYSIDYSPKYGELLEYEGYWSFNQHHRRGAITSTSLERGCAWLINY